MPYRVTLVLVLGWWAWGASPASAPQDKTSLANEELIRQVLAGTTSDRERAIKLFEAGQPLKDDPPAQTALLTRAVDYGMKDVSEAAVRTKVLAAIDLLSAQDEDNRASWLTKKLDVLRAGARAGATPEDRAQAGNQLLATLSQLAQASENAKQWDKAVDWWTETATAAKKIRPDAFPEYRSRLEWAKHYAAAAHQAADLIEKLKAKEDSRARATLLFVQTAELNDPGEARKFLTPDVAETWRAQVPLASQKPDSLTVDASHELARWYAGTVLKDCRNDFARILVLRRAAAAYNRILDDKTFAAAPERKGVLAEFNGVETQLAKLGETIARPATIYICCDDDFVLYVNGHWAGEGWGYQALRKYDVKLAPGDVVAVRGRDSNGGRSAGLFCTIEMRDLYVPSGKDWRCSVKPPPPNWASVAPGPGDRPVSLTNIAPEHKNRKFPNATGQFMWSPETAPLVYFKLLIPR